MAAIPGRGIGNLGDVRRPPPFRYFIKLYRTEAAFRTMIEFAVLGTLTIAFLEPQSLLHPFRSQGAGTTQHQAAAPAAAPSPAAPQPVVSPPASPAPAAPQSPPASSAQAPNNRSNAAATPQPPAPAPNAASTPAPAPAATTDSSKAVANLLKLPSWAAVPVRPVDTPGLHSLPIPFTNFVTGATHPPSRYLTFDDRSLASLPYQLRETVKTALAVRADEDGDRVREVLKDIDSPEGTPELLIGLSYLIAVTPESASLAEKSYRVAMQKGQPQAPALLGLLLTSNTKGIAGNESEGKSLIESVMANDRSAWLFKGSSYLNGESGSLDPGKAVPWIVKAAEAGEPLALLQYARLADNGIAMEKNSSLAEGALRRAVELGLTEAEEILGLWILNAYEKKFITDPTEGVRLLEKVIAKHWLAMSGELGRFYAFYGTGDWKDEARGAKLLQECTAYKVASCHNNLAIVLQSGRGIDRDIVASWAHFDVARQLGSEFPVSRLAQLEKTMTPGEKDDAHKQSKELFAQLKITPRVISLKRD
jgi:TPR repeat protein